MKRYETSVDLAEVESKDNNFRSNIVTDHFINEIRGNSSPSLSLKTLPSTSNMYEKTVYTPSLKKADKCGTKTPHYHHVTKSRRHKDTPKSGGRRRKKRPRSTTSSKRSASFKSNHGSRSKLVERSRYPSMKSEVKGHHQTLSSDKVRPQKARSKIRRKKLLIR